MTIIQLLQNIDIKSDVTVLSIRNGSILCRISGGTTNKAYNNCSIVKMWADLHCEIKGAGMVYKPCICVYINENQRVNPCLYCGEEVPEGAHVCPNCEKDLTKGAEKDESANRM